MKTFAEELEANLVATIKELIDEDFRNSKFAAGAKKVAPQSKGGLGFGKQRPVASPDAHRQKFPEVKHLPAPKTKQPTGPLSMRKKLEL